MPFMFSEVSSSLKDSNPNILKVWKLLLRISEAIAGSRTDRFPLDTKEHTTPGSHCRRLKSSGCIYPRAQQLIQSRGLLPAAAFSPRGRHLYPSSSSRPVSVLERHRLFPLLSHVYLQMTASITVRFRTYRHVTIPQFNFSSRSSVLRLL